MSDLLLRAYRGSLAIGHRGKAQVWRGEHREATRLHNRGLACYWRDPGLAKLITLTKYGTRVARRLHQLQARCPR